MAQYKELTNLEMQKIIGGENDHRMPNQLNRPNKLSKGGARCGAGVVAGLSAIPAGPLGWLGGIATVVGNCI